MHKLRLLACAVLALLVVAPPVVAQEGFGRGGWELNVYGGVLNGVENNFVLSDQAGLEVTSFPLFGARAGYVFMNNIFIEGEFGYAPLKRQLFGVDQDDFNVLQYGGALGYNFQLAEAFQLFLAVGAGAMSYDVKGVTDFAGNESTKMTDFSWNWGGGIRIFPAHWIAIRADLRSYVLPNGLTKWYESLPGATEIDPSLNATQDLEATVGLSFYLGTNRDEDGDGVADKYDACPGTPRGVEVDERGCPWDSDADGVPDYLDKCPDTPAGARVDADGCPIDSDGDGVFDGIDQCPNTPAGATVDARGCPTDSDGDGVYDGIDQCPNTPRGATVDSRGCPLDGDGDGVPDGIDQCPNTPAGLEVDENGCTRLEAAVIEGVVVFSNIEFAFDSFELSDASKTTLDEIAAAIVANATQEGTATLEIAGYTDAIGPAAYNLMLSQKRADAVLDFMMTVEPGLAAYEDRITAVGNGQTNFIADNDTEEGRALNRRVEFYISE
jgi:outer membrane beta-barrel protein